jgi:hypothetical protein
MRIEPAALARSAGTLTTLDPSEGFPEALQQVVDAAKLLFEADGAGLMLVGKGELLTWASASDAQAERAEAVQAELGRPLHGRLAQRSPVAVRDVEAEACWSQVVPALAAAQLRAALSVPVELAWGPHRDPGGVCGRAAGLERQRAGGLAGLCRGGASLLRAAAAARAQGELAEQLRWALQHRVLIEQAKGMLMDREGLSPAAAFERLRTHGPYGWAHRRRAGRCRPGRGQPAPPIREPSRTASKDDPG